MDAENAFAPLHVRPVDDDAAIETARAQQRRVEHVWTVGGRHENDAFIRLEAVHLDEKLVQRLFALVMSAAEPRAAVAADGVDFVNEHDARCVLLALFEQVAHAGGAHADEHLHEVGAADGEERHVRLAGDGARQQRLAGARGAHQQDALRNPAAELLELLRLAQEVDDFLQLFLRLVYAGDVLERHLLLGARRQLRLALAERERLVAAALHLPHEENPEADHQQDRRPGIKECRPWAGRRLASRHDDIPLEQTVRQPLVLRRSVGAEVLVGFVDADNLVARNGDAIDLSGIDRCHELGKTQRLMAGLELGRKLPDEGADDHKGHPEHQAFQGRVQASSPTMYRI